MKAKTRRRLQVSISGRWYLGLTILLGVAALSSGNNILYLLESFLLGGLILSGVLSELAVSALDFRWKRRQAIAQGFSNDHIEVTNRKRIPFFCIELGEWKGKQFIPRAFVPYIPARSTVKIQIDRPYESFGRYRWDGVGLATQFPFGFARKLSFLSLPGHRIVWPEQTSKGDGESHPGDPQVKSKPKSGSESYSDGEIRPMLPSDDLRDVVWTLSFKREEPVVRIRRSQSESIVYRLDLRKIPIKVRNERLKQIANLFYEASSGFPKLIDATLVLITDEKSKQLRDPSQALDEIALLRQEEAS